MPHEIVNYIEKCEHYAPVLYDKIYCAMLHYERYTLPTPEHAIRRSLLVVRPATRTLFTRTLLLTKFSIWKKTSSSSWSDICLCWIYLICLDTSPSRLSTGGAVLRPAALLRSKLPKLILVENIIFVFIKSWAKSTKYYSLNFTYFTFISSETSEELYSLTFPAQFWKILSKPYLNPLAFIVTIVILNGFDTFTRFIVMLI